MNGSPGLAAVVKFAILAACLNRSPQGGMACLNEYEHPHVEPTQKQLTRQHAAEYLAGIDSGKSVVPSAEALEQLRLAAADGDYRAKSDYAVALARHGDLPQSLEILKAIEVQQPGEYIIASNLGTVFELSGDDRQALEWITIGLHRNPASHDGSEWLHVKILQAKLALAKDPAWLNTHSVLGLDFGGADTPSRPAQTVTDQDGHALSLTDVRRALEYQLRERLSLVKPTDAVVANLLFDLGNLLMLEKSPDFAYGVYQVADRYADDVPLIHQRLIASRGAHGLGGARFMDSLLACAVGVVIVAIIRLYLKEYFGSSRQPAT